jgi:acyl-CoA synthetase (AMP-forming)/AMP-acid ligase II/acyl carrier protein
MRAVIGGEAVPPELAARLRDQLDGLWNFYGPTETTVWSTCWKVAQIDGAVPIGRPIANTTIHLLGPSGRDVPTGAIGELCIGGAGLARGYHRRPELTAEKFTSHPEHGRIYRTGDLARLRPDGLLEYHGRTDHQVKLRGHRIELGEIETVIAEHPHVRQAVAVVREDQPGDQRLVAYALTDATLDTDALQRHLAGRLPAHMIPGAIVALDALPLTPNGKLDRAALPAPQASPDAERTPPSTPIEHRLADLFKEVLALDEVGIHDSFFHLGGHSLTATRLIAHTNQEFNLRLSLRTVFEAPTIAQLAQAIVTSLLSDDSDDLLGELELADLA